MDCRQVRDLLLTDVVDGEADVALRETILKHLAKCSECRDFEADIQRKVREPFKGTREINPPEPVWHRIKERIEVKRAPVFSFDWARFRKPALGLAFAGVVLIVASVLLIPPENGIDVFLGQQAEFLAELETDETVLAGASGDSLGTVIEAFFM